MALPGTWYKAFLDARDSPQQQQQQQQQQTKLMPEPPVLFVHMTRDEHTAARVKENVKIRQGKVSTANMYIGHVDGCENVKWRPPKQLAHGKESSC
jgi:hypothetical protein